MKRIISIIIIGFIFVLSHAQNHKSYYKNGLLREIGTLKNEKEIGEWKWYFDNGRLESVGTYNNGHQTGEWKEYYSNGKLRRIRNFNNGFLTGKLISYHDNEKLMLTGIFDADGKKTGEWKRYHFSGKLMGITIYKNDKGKKNGKWTYYNKDGTLDEIENYKYGKKNGKWEYYHYNGILYLTENYINDLLSGEYNEYYNNGKISTTKNYKDDILHGEYKIYDGNGNYTETGNYINGLLSGEYNEYNNGKISTTKNYKDDILHGEYKIYDDNGNGNYTETGNYIEGKQDGKSTYYNKKNKIKYEHFWSKGKLMETSSFHDENGNILDGGTLKNGNGTVKKYDDDGELISVDEYLFGKEIRWYNSNSLNSLAWKIYENESDSEILLKAIKLITRSIELNSNYYNTDTYAALLYKTGNYEQALVIANEAIEIAKTNEDDFKSTQKLIKLIHLKLKEVKLTTQVWGETNDEIIKHRGKSGLILLQLNSNYTFKAFENTDFGAAILQTGNWSLKNNILTFEVLKTKNYTEHSKMNGKILSDKESGSVTYKIDELKDGELILKSKAKRFVFKKSEFSYFPDK